MASETEIVIYPDLRISDLKQDLIQKHQKLEASKNGLKFLLENKFRPLTFLKDNRTMLIGGFLTVFPFAAFLTKMFTGKGKSGLLWKVLSLGWLWKIVRVSGGLIKTASWVAQGVSRFL